MSTTSAPFGLAPAYSPSGTLRPAVYPILSTYGTGILTNQPVKIGTNGTIEAAAVNDRFIGTFQGVTYTGTDGVTRFSPNWVASTVGTDIRATVSLDPTIIYQIQANATMAASTVGGQYDFTAASGSTVTGLSTQMLDVASVAANAALQVIGLNPGPDNAFGDAFPIVLVRISEHQMVADVAQF